MNLDTPEIMNLDTPEGVFVSLLCINPHRIVAQNFERTRQEKKRHRLILYDCTEAGTDLSQCLLLYLIIMQNFLSAQPFSIRIRIN